MLKGRRSVATARLPPPGPPSIIKGFYAHLENEIERVDKYEQDDDGDVSRDEGRQVLVLLRRILHKRQHLCNTSQTHNDNKTKLQNIKQANKTIRRGEGRSDNAPKIQRQNTDKTTLKQGNKQTRREGDGGGSYQSWHLHTHKNYTHKYNQQRNKEDVGGRLYQY